MSSSLKSKDGADPVDAPSAGYAESKQGSLEYGDAIYQTSDSRRQIGLVSAIFL